MQTIVRLSVVGVLFAAVFAIQSRIDRLFGQYRTTEEILYIDNGASMKRVLLGFDNIAADLYWLRTVQYFGGKRLEETNKDYDLLEPLLRITVDLDPEFKIAYSYGATFLAEPFPAGAGMPSKAIEIIDRAIEQLVITARIGHVRIEILPWDADRIHDLDRDRALDAAVGWL